MHKQIAAGEYFRNGERPAKVTAYVEYDFLTQNNDTLLRV